MNDSFALLSFLNFCLYFGLFACGCPSTPSLVQQCAEICGDTGVQRVTPAECVCQPKFETPATVPFDPTGC